MRLALFVGVLALSACDKGNSDGEKSADQPVTAAAAQSTETKTETATDTSTTTETGTVEETGDEVKADPPKAIVDADGKAIGLFDGTKLTVTIKNDEDEDVVLKLKSLEEGFDETDSRFGACGFLEADCSSQCLLLDGKSGMKSPSEIYIPGKLAKTITTDFQEFFKSQLKPNASCEAYVVGTVPIPKATVSEKARAHAPLLTTFKLPFRYATE